MTTSVKTIISSHHVGSRYKTGQNHSKQQLIIQDYAVLLVWFEEGSLRAREGPEMRDEQDKEQKGAAEGCLQLGD